MKKVKFIYNPFSGEAVVTKNLDTIIGKYQAKGYTIVPFRISTEQNLEDAFLDIDSSYHHILGAGGDGTINQIINIMKKKNLDIPLAILPVGTANDFAKYIGMPADIGSACDKILAGKIQEIDLGKANDKYFINVFSFGLFTDVSHKTPTHLKNTIGKLAYYLNGIKELPSFKKLDIKVTSDEFFYEGNALIFFTFNGRTAGNINISYKIDESDKTPGFKFAEAEVKGYPVRIEVGPRDLSEGYVTVVRRDNLEKIKYPISDVVDKLGDLFKDIQDNMYNSALKRRNSMIYEANSWEEFKDIATNKPGFIKANWCGDEECETKVKEEFNMKSRCLIEDEEIHTNCVVCGKKAKYRLYFGRQY